MMKILKGNIFSYLTPPQLLSLAEIGAIGALSALKIANLATNEGKNFMHFFSLKKSFIT